jgi:NAD(P)-dependent dehydrogenase (short-subunit alcohol dehydrogenase family)
MPSSSPSSRAALITGCSSGIGRATALHLQQQGWKVYATARTPAQLEELRAAGCVTAALDVTDPASAERVVRDIEREHGAVGALINNAGYSQSGAVEAVPMDRVRAQFETNVFGVVQLIQLVLPKMRQAGRGRIVNLSSMGGKLVFPGGGFYHATKYAIEALSDALRFEVKGFGVDVVLIEPGLIRSGFAQAAVREMTSNPAAAVYEPFHRAVGTATQESYERGPLAKLAGSPDDVARTIAKALAAKHPKTRYTVSGSATLLLFLRRRFSDRGWDRFVGKSFPAPSAAKQLGA